MAQRDAEWHMIGHCIVNWIHTTVTKNVFDIIHKPRASAFTVWNDIKGLSRDNELHRAVYIKAEFRSINQGDMNIVQYTGRLKQLADNLRDVGQPVSKPSQVLNLLRGLHPKYRHVKPVITSKFPPHTFMSARSYLLLEEIQLNHDNKVESGHALYARHGGSTTTTSDASSPRSKGKNKKRGRGGATTGGGSTPSLGSSGSQQRGQPSPWAAGYNPWTDLVQAWPMPFRPWCGRPGPSTPVPSPTGHDGPTSALTSRARRAFKLWLLRLG
jgi:hypothetical protein